MTGQETSVEESLEKERYDRQLRVSGWRQELLQKATVLIAGVGALGCEISKNLALMGVGKLILVDNDVVELSNLSRQILFRDQDIGRSKSQAAAEKIREMNRYVEVKPVEGDLRRIPLEYYEEASVICACVDNWPTRRWLNSTAVETGKPLVDVAMEGVYANVQDIIPGKTPCIECHGEELIPREVQAAECTLRRRRPEDLAQDLKEQGITVTLQEAEELFKAGIKTIFDIKYSPLGGLLKLNPSGGELIQRIRELLRPKMPALQSVAAAISGIATMEIIKILHRGSLGKPYSGLIIYDALASRVTRVPLSRNKECFVCGEYARGEEATLTMEKDTTVLQLKEVIAQRYMYPDPEVQYKTKILKDDVKLGQLTADDELMLFIHTSRRLNPLTIKVKLI
ncbi:MAG TPA: hypothetical protein EYH45_02075 [Candidatus Caldiarchaeum subterraneum]|uniref:Ubiquitin-like domain-containing protein n=1 Tax=Caldiarchaeum subterraneum TaxID=311458 RepID=A0A832ZUR7_CALS0|nr:hypothetical protein [Candidatus Caldarchaeum subterraneum]